MLCLLRFHIGKCNNKCQLNWRHTNNFEQILSILFCLVYVIHNQYNKEILNNFTESEWTEKYLTTSESFFESHSCMESSMCLGKTWHFVKSTWCCSSKLRRPTNKWPSKISINRDFEFHIVHQSSILNNL